MCNLCSSKRQTGKVRLTITHPPRMEKPKNEFHQNKTVPVMYSTVQKECYNFSVEQGAILVCILFAQCCIRRAPAGFKVCSMLLSSRGRKKKLPVTSYGILGYPSHIFLNPNMERNCRIATIPSLEYATVKATWPEIKKEQKKVHRFLIICTIYNLHCKPH